MKLEAAVMVFCWADVPGIYGSWSPGCACLGRIEDCASGAWWCVGYSVVVVLAFQYMVGG